MALPFDVSISPLSCFLLLWLAFIGFGLAVLQPRTVFRVLGMLADMAWLTACAIIAILGFVALEERGPMLFGLDKTMVDVGIAAVLLRGLLVLKNVLEHQVTALEAPVANGVRSTAHSVGATAVGLIGK